MDIKLLLLIIEIVAVVSLMILLLLLIFNVISPLVATSGSLFFLSIISLLPKEEDL